MRKKGFTLIELVCSMAILSVFVISSFSIVKPMIKIAKEQEQQTIIYLTEDILCYGKLYCKYNKKSLNGIISNNKIMLYDNKGFSRYYQLPNGYEYNSSNTNKRFIINNRGEINISTTIDLKYKGKSVDKVSITVGSESINVK